MITTTLAKNVQSFVSHCEWPRSAAKSAVLTNMIGNQKFIQAMVDKMSLRGHQEIVGIGHLLYARVVLSTICRSRRRR